VSFDDEARLSGCNVVYDDRRMDLAVVSCEGKSSHLSWGLDLSTEKPQDLDSVIAAGFPALGGAPAYQSTEGKISNSHYKDEHKRMLLQHTAAIDPGSSGGPLLNERGQLLGVNTLKARGRDSVYLAVPVQDVETILDKALFTQQSFADPEAKKAALLAACRGFADEVASKDGTSEVLSDFISNELIAKDGFESLNMVVQAMPAHAERLSMMFLLDPIAAMRFAIVLRLSVEVEGAGGSCECEAINENDAQQLDREAGVRVKLRVGGDRHEGKWVVEHGHWKLSGFQF
jgi:serine protease Do